jgi:hypothetical protein
MTYNGLRISEYRVCRACTLCLGTVTEKHEKMAKYEKPLHTALHAQTYYRHGVNC